MALSFSTPLRNQMLSVGSFKSIMDGGVVRVYSGPVPTGACNADQPIGPGNTLLLEISVDGGGTGLSWDGSAGGGTITKSLSEVWTGDVTTGGSPTFFRIVKQSDGGAVATTEPRVQGLAGVDMGLTSSLLVQGTPQRLQYAQITIPPQ